MKLAVVAVTSQGAELAIRIKATLPHEDIKLYLPEGKIDIPAGEKSYLKLSEAIEEIWPDYDGIICIMATGIVVRLIASLLKSKRQDPAVVVLDEKGRNVISLLSGHLGGANALTEKLGLVLGANPVITTATDVNNLPAMEMVAREMGCKIENFNLVKKVNAALVNGEPLIIYTDVPLNIKFPPSVRRQSLASYREKVAEVNVAITNRAMAFADNTLIIRPRNLVLGLGCRRGMSAEKIKAAIEEGLAKAGLVIESVRLLASIDIKKDEAGILEAARNLKVPVEFYPASEINGLYESNKGSELSYSSFVHEKLGVGGVCEAVTLLSSPEAKLVLKKMKMEGVTVAIAEES